MDRRGQFTTLGEPPQWLVEYNALKPLDNYHDATWMAVHAQVAGAPPLRTLTYDPDHPERFLDLYQASPLRAGAQFELLASLIEKEALGQGDSFDFVCVLAGSTARLGYEVGARSPLMRQMVLKLDEQLEYLLEPPQDPARRKRVQSRAGRRPRRAPGTCRREPQTHGGGGRKRGPDGRSRAAR